MKSILLSIRPEWLVKILNRDKTYEVRKLFPKNYVGWVYLYCSKDTSNGYLVELYDHSTDDTLGYSTPYYEINKYKGSDIMPMPLNGKVVARFWCDKVDKWDVWQEDLEEKIKLSCLSIKEFDDYSKGQVAYAIHISKLEIFDEPRELSEFYTTKLDEDLTKRFDNSIQLENGTWVKRITKAPQNYCYVEGEQL